MAATRNIPAAMLLKSKSQTTRRCQGGGLVVGLSAYPAAGMSAPQHESRDQHNRQRSHSAERGADVIPLHVQPWIEWRRRQAVGLGAIDQQIERVQFGVCLRSRVAIKIGGRQ